MAFMALASLVNQFFVHFRAVRGKNNKIAK